jgi:hypothetical protein
MPAIVRANWTNQRITMKKVIIAVALACASVAAHADFAIQIARVVPPEVDPQAVVKALVKAGIPAYAQTVNGAVTLRAGPFATQQQAQAEFPKVAAVFAKIMADPNSIRATPAPASAPISTPAAPAVASVPASDAASKRAADMVATAKQMDSEWQIYSPARRECETLTVFFGRITGRDMGIRTPEQFAAYYRNGDGSGTTIHYGHGGEAAEIDGGDVKYMLAHGTDACNEMAKAIQGDGY